MPRKKNKPEIIRAELLPPSRTVSETDFKRMVADAIEQKVAEAMSHGSEADFQPWFQPREVHWEIVRRQTVAEQNKFSYYFEDWGCMACGTKEKAHDSLGFCRLCYDRIRHRLRTSMRKRSPAAKKDDLTFSDTVRLAREAIAPALHALPAKTTRRTKARQP